MAGESGSVEHVMAKVVSHGNAVSKHDGKTDRRRDILGLKELPQPERKALFRDAQTHAPVLSEAEKQLLFRDGYVVIKNVVSRQAVENALLVCVQLSTQNPGQPGIGTQDAALVGLYNDSVFTEIIEEAIGPHTLPVVGFLAVGMGPLPPDAPMPQCHVDGAGLLHLKHSEIINSGQDLHVGHARRPADARTFWRCAALAGPTQPALDRFVHGFLRRVSQRPDAAGQGPVLSASRRAQRRRELLPHAARSRRTARTRWPDVAAAPSGAERHSYCGRDGGCDGGELSVTTV